MTGTALKFGICLGLAVSGLALPGEAQHVTADTTGMHLRYLDEALLAGAVVGALALLDTAAWGLMTSDS